MNLHEYQAKQLIKKYGVAVQEGMAVSTPHEAEEAYRQIKTTYGSPFAVVKAQIHAGGRGKGKIRETGINGVKVVKSLDEVCEVAQKMLSEDEFWDKIEQLKRAGAQGILVVPIEKMVI